MAAAAVESAYAARTFPETVSIGVAERSNRSYVLAQAVTSATSSAASGS